MKTISFLSVIFFILLPYKSWAGGSVIGHGGDPIFHFLETTRLALIETLKLHAADNKNKINFCSNVNSLNTPQVQFCQNFLEHTRDQILTLNRGDDKTQFILKKDPVLVPGPNGKPMPVAARTQLGPQGSVEFHRDSIQFYSPVKALFLLTHEFGHKVSFKGRFLNDYDPIGPFSTGRELLDAVAESISKVAKEFGKIGVYFGLRDFFRCEIVLPNGYITGVTTSTPRFFLAKDFSQYEAGLGRSPQDSEVFVYEPGQSRLVYQIKISELNECLPGYKSKSSSDLKIIRVFAPNRSGYQKPNETVASTVINYNPICQEEPEWLSLTADDIEFKCLFLGTQGTTHNDINYFKY